MKMKEAGQTVGKFAIGAGGLTAGAIAMKVINSKLPASFPEIAKKLAPGLAGMLLAYLLSAKISNENAKALFFGLGLAGFADLAKKLLGDKVTFIADNVPTLSGMPINTGDYPPDYYERNTFQGVPMQGVPMQGLGNMAQQLNGMGNLSQQLNGLGNLANRLNGNANYDLQGYGARVLAN